MIDQSLSQTGHRTPVQYYATRTFYLLLISFPIKEREPLSQWHGKTGRAVQGWKLWTWWTKRKRTTCSALSCRALRALWRLSLDLNEFMPDHQLSDWMAGHRWAQTCGAGIERGEIKPSGSMFQHHWLYFREIERKPSEIDWFDGKLGHNHSLLHVFTIEIWEFPIINCPKKTILEHQISLLHQNCHTLLLSWCHTASSPLKSASRKGIAKHH